MEGAENKEKLMTILEENKKGMLWTNHAQNEKKFMNWEIRAEF